MIGHQDFFLFVPALLLSILLPLFLSSSVSLPYCILAVLICECFEKHSCMSTTFPIAIRNGTCFFLIGATTCAQKRILRKMVILAKAIVTWIN